MPIDEVYRRQVALLVRAIPEIAPETCFALKGGTAINLFVRDMPRVSVDIDLTYVPVEDRRASLIGIHQAMQRIAERLKAGIRNAEVMASVLRGQGCVTKLVVRADDVQIKIEVTPVLRGCVYDPVTRSVTPRVEERFGFAEAQVVSLPDLYAGKIIAALDRQHPRDLFDVRTLLANEGISDDLRKAFVVYLVSQDGTTGPMSQDVGYAVSFSVHTAEPHAKGAGHEQGTLDWIGCPCGDDRGRGRRCGR